MTLVDQPVGIAYFCFQWPLPQCTDTFKVRIYWDYLSLISHRTLENTLNTRNLGSENKCASRTIANFSENAHIGLYDKLHSFACPAPHTARPGYVTV